IDGLCKGYGDTCDHPIVLTAGDNTIRWVADGVDYFIGDPSCDSTDPTGPDIVMSYTATDNGILEYSITKPSSTRWSMVVSTGACGTLTPETHCFSDWSPTQLTNSFPVTAGTTYYFYLRDTTSGTLPLSNPLTVNINEFVPPCVPGTGGIVGSTMSRVSTDLPSFTEYYMAADENPSGYVYIGGTLDLRRLPKSGGTSEDVETLAGLTSSQVGYDVVVAGNEIFTIDDSDGSSGRVFRISRDGGATWISGGED